MHTIKFDTLISENQYYDDGRLTNKVMPVHLVKNGEQVGHGMRSNTALGFQTWFNGKPGNDLQLDSQITLTKGHKTVLQEPLSGLDFVQIGVNQALSSIVIAPTVVYSLIIFIPTQQVGLIGLVDFNLKNFPEYMRVFKAAQVPVEDPFNLNSVDFEHDQIESYLKQNFEHLAKDAGYPLA